jgi:four helix bundle protein
MGTHKDLLVWQNSIGLVKEVYRMTNGFPKTEIYGITSQVRRAAVSVPANISEGAARMRPREFHYFLRVSFASLMELETLLIIAVELNYLSGTDFDILQNRIRLITVQLSRLLHSIEKNNGFFSSHNPV